MANEKPLILKNGKFSQMESGVDTIDSVFLPPSSGSYQKYYVAPSETYTIPNGISSVVTGPMEIEGILDLQGRLEVL